MIELSPDIGIKAAANNAHWCDAMLRSHSSKTCTKPHLWFTVGEAPLYYPHAVTLGGPAHARQQYADISRLLQAARQAGRSIAIKDSFACLDLASLSCELLFAAQWLCFAKTASEISDIGLNLAWRHVQDAAELILWERAWCGSSPKPGIFLPSLLANTDVTVLAGYSHGHIVAGCTLYRSQEAIGYTNLFVPSHEAESWRLGCIAEIMRRFPSYPIVGYESGLDSIAMQNIGFRTIGELRVWRSAGR